MEILRERGWPEAVIRAVGAHAFYTGIERVTPMEKAILAADELSGFVGACALVRPSRRIADVPVESVLKRMKEKAFARSVDRSYIVAEPRIGARRCPSWSRWCFARRWRSPAGSGSSGAPAAELPDEPVPAGAVRRGRSLSLRGAAGRAGASLRNAGPRGRVHVE